MELESLVPAWEIKPSLRPKRLAEAYEDGGPVWGARSAGD
jgi:hypothetical protein